MKGPRRVICDADRILYHLIRAEEPIGFSKEEVETDGSGSIRRMEAPAPTVAVLSQTAIGEFYLDPWTTDANAGRHPRESKQCSQN